jgi:hypothetical protein
LEPLSLGEPHNSSESGAGSHAKRLRSPASASNQFFNEEAAGGNGSDGPADSCYAGGKDAVAAWEALQVTAKKYGLLSFFRRFRFFTVHRSSF